MEGAQKRFLEELFGVRGVSGEAEKRSIQRAVESFEELTGRLLVPAKHLFCKLLIGQLVLSDGSSSPLCPFFSPRNHAATLSKTSVVA